MIYTTQTGKTILVEVIKDCGMVRNEGGHEWHKMICRPVGFNNSLLMVVGAHSLKEQDDRSGV